MFIKLIKHSWIAFRRAHYFQKSLGIKLLIGFVVFIMLFYILMAGMALPGILQDIAPGQKAHEIIFSFLVFIFLADFFTRYFIQKIPAQKITPYLHYPVSKNSIASFFLARAWFSVFNVYLLIFFLPFFAFTIIPNISQQAFWYTIAGMLVLSGLNHSLVFFIKTNAGKSYTVKIFLILLIVAFAIYSWFYTGQVLNASLWLGNSLMNASAGVFAVLIVMIVFLQTLAKRNLKKGFYHLLESRQEEKISQKSTFAERLFLKVPVFGKYWDLEWKLITRNKRAKNNFYQFPVMFPLLILFFWWYPVDNIIQVLALLMLFVGSYGFFHLQFFLSWESRFFDFLASRNICFNDFVKAKFYFYSLLALIQFFIMLPFLFFIDVILILVYASVMIYTTGVGFFIMMYAGVNHSARIDPDQKAFFNFEGISGNQFLMIILVVLSIIPAMIIGYIVHADYGVYAVLLIAGIVSWAFHPVWIRKVADNFMKRKYSKLEKYRKD